MNTNIATRKSILRSSGVIFLLVFLFYVIGKRYSS